MKIKSLVFMAVLAAAVFGCRAPIVRAAQDMNCMEVVGGSNYNTEERITCLQNAIATLMAQLQAMQAQQGTGATAWCHNFNNYLVAGNNSSEVNDLKTALSKDGENVSMGAGDLQGVAFDDTVAAAVVQFQGKYNIRQTGTVGPLTRAKLNSLYGCKNTVCPLYVTQVCGSDGKTYSGNSCLGYGMPSGVIVASQGACTITTQPSITVTSPNGGETWQKGTTHNITWTGSPSVLNQTGDIRLVFPVPACAESGANPACMIAVRAPLTIATGVNLNSGSYAWNVGNILSNVTTACMAGESCYQDPVSAGQYKIQICPTNVNSISQCDNSDNYFTIVAPTATQVNGVCGLANGQTFATAPATNLCSAGTASAVTTPEYVGGWYWTCAGLNGGALTHCTALIGFAQPTITPSNAVVNSGSQTTFSWNIPNSIGAIAAAINIACPSGISITTSGSLSNLCNTNYGILGTTYASTMQSFVFTNSGTSSSTVTLQITTGNVDGTSNKSNMATIIVQPTTPSITITSPNGGEQWIIGETHNITWKSNGVNDVVLIKLEKNNPSADWYLFPAVPASNVLASAGSYTWTIPSSISENLATAADYKIEILDASNASITDSSDNYFSISAPIVAQSTYPAATNGACSSINGATLSGQPTNLCSIGTPSAVIFAQSSLQWTWTCQGINGGATANCSALSASVNAVCGSANGVAVTVAPTANLCLSGLATHVVLSADSSYWYWMCAGSGRGTSDNCSANVAH